MRLLFTPYTLKFKEPAGTSRGVMLEKPTWFLRLQDEHDPSHFGIGEAAYFPGLSPEDPEKYVYKIIELLANVALGRATDLSPRRCNSASSRLSSTIPTEGEASIIPRRSHAARGI